MEGGGERGVRGPPSFPGFFFLSFETNRLSSGTVQSTQGCSCVVGMEQCSALTKNLFGPLFLVSFAAVFGMSRSDERYCVTSQKSAAKETTLFLNFLDPPLHNLIG